MAAEFPKEVIIRDYGSLLDAFRIAKETRQVSYLLLDHVCGLASGHSEKLLGINQVKRIGPAVLGLLLEGLGVELVMRENVAAARRLAHRWEKINANQVRHGQRLVSQATIDRWAPVIMSELAKKGWQTRRLARRANGHNGHRYNTAAK